MERAQQSIVEFKAYLKGCTTSASKQPRDDMMSWLMEVQRSDRSLTEDDVVLLLHADPQRRPRDDADHDRQHA